MKQDVQYINIPVRWSICKDSGKWSTSFILQFSCFLEYHIQEILFKLVISKWVFLLFKWHTCCPGSSSNRRRCNKPASPPRSIKFILSYITNPTAAERSHCSFEWTEVHLRKESGVQFIQEAALTSNGKSNYTHGGHVRAHMLEKRTPSTGRISSNTMPASEFCMHTQHAWTNTHKHTPHNPRGQLS